MNNQHSIPVDKTAALVVSRGFHFETTGKINEVHSDSPMAIRPARNSAEAERHKQLIGLRRGRLTVIGASAEVKQRYVVRCDCGKYTLRTAKAMRNEANIQERCGYCRRLAQARRGYAYHVNGIEIDINQL